MPLSIPQFNTGDKINASDVKDRLQRLESFLNGKITSSDLQSTLAWVDSDLIVRPEFYASPAPRMQGTTADVHHRRVSNNLVDSVIFFEELSNDYIPIPGLSASFHVADSAQLSVLCSFMTFEIGASDVASSVTGETNKVARLRLFVDGTGIRSTQRIVFANNDGRKYSRKQHSICYHHTAALSAGNHSVSVRMKVIGDGGSSRTFKKIHVAARNLVTNIQYR
jgi:hypothetical protein